MHDVLSGADVLMNFMICMLSLGDIDMLCLETPVASGKLWCKSQPISARSRLKKLALCLKIRICRVSTVFNTSKAPRMLRGTRTSVGFQTFRPQNKRN